MKRYLLVVMLASCAFDYDPGTGSHFNLYVDAGTKGPDISVGKPDILIEEPDISRTLDGHFADISRTLDLGSPGECLSTDDCEDNRWCSRLTCLDPDNRDTCAHTDTGTCLLYGGPCDIDSDCVRGERLCVAGYCAVCVPPENCLADCEVVVRYGGCSRCECE
jgi:hypothetical protein